MWHRMLHHARWLLLLVGVGLLGLGPAAAPCSAQTLAATTSGAEQPPEVKDDSPAALAAATVARIDNLFAASWREAKITPAAPADDAEFLRRVYLDLCGVIPLVPDAREFLADTRPDKRARLVERLLAHPAHAAHLAKTWRDMLLPGDDADTQPGAGDAFEAGLRAEFARNYRYDNLVADLLVASGSPREAGGVQFFAARGAKPEEVAASTARLFLGVQIECAQCHNHPFDHWTQQDFWGYAAFFARLKQRQGQVVQIDDEATGEVKHPKTNEVVLPHYLGGEAAPADPNSSRRMQAAIWIVSRDNPYFARATTNRVWAMLFGHGLVEPVDDFGDHNPPSQPDVLEAATKYFVDSGYDLRGLFQVLVSTRAYQLSSRGEAGQEAPPAESFARMALKPLTAEQLYSCLARASRKRLPPVAMAAMQPGQSPIDGERQLFLADFRQRGPLQLGVPQVLALSNGPTVAAATDPNQSPLLGSLAAPFFTDEERLDVVYLSALSRPASARERERALVYLASAPSPAEKERALADVFWAVLNSPEFVLNH